MALETLDNTAAPPTPPPRPGFNMKFAMIVPALGLFILVAFIAAGFLTSNPIQKTKTSTSSFSVPGTPLRALPAQHDLKVITVNGQPPGNIINSVSVPVGSTRVSYMNNTAAAQQYDAQIVLTSNQSQGAIDKFFTKAMKKQGWKIYGSGPADHDPGGLDVLGSKAGSDGFFWEMGATVQATTFGAHGPAAGTTSFTVRLFQQPDPD